MQRQTARRLRRPFIAFRRTESGGLTVEFVLWLPMMVALLALVADVSMIFYQQSYAVRVVQDANRALSLGRIKDVDELQTMVASTLSYMSPNIDVKSAVVDGVISTSAAMPASDLDAVGWFTALSKVQVTVQSQHLME